MIDFNNGKAIKLSKVKEKNIPKNLFDLLIPGENIVEYYSGIRDYVVFTDKRIISCNVQGFTGSKQDFTSIPYSKIQAFSVESAGTFDMDSELTLSLSGLGTVKFEFSSGSNIRAIGQTIGAYIL